MAKSISTSITTLQRISITTVLSAKDFWFEYCHKEGYHITKFYATDERFYIYGEREIDCACEGNITNPRQDSKRTRRGARPKDAAKETGTGERPEAARSKGQSQRP